MNLNVGTYYIGIEAHYDSSQGSISINKEKSDSDLKVKVSGKEYTAKQLKKSAKTFSIGAKASNKISYTVKSWKKYINVSSSGKVTIKKRTPKGVYKISYSTHLRRYID